MAKKIIVIAIILAAIVALVIVVSQLRRGARYVSAPSESAQTLSQDDVGGVLEVIEALE